MKLMIGLPALLALSLTTPPQTTREKTLEQTLKEESLKKINRFMQSLKHTNYCPFRNMDGILAEFDYSATIAVSGKSNPKGIPHLPAEYFKNLEKLRCGPYNSYQDMKFTFRPIDGTRDITVKLSAVNERHEVTIKFNQEFRGNGSPGHSYCDITIKKATLHFWVDRATNVLKGRIMNIEVVETNDCNGADTKHSTTP